MERAPLGFCLMLRTPPGTPATHVRPRPGHEHEPGTTPLIWSNLQSACSLICVRPRVANPSGLPLACSPRMERPPLRLSPGLRTPPTRSRRRTPRGTGQRARTWNYTLNITSRLILQSVVHSQRATSRRTTTRSGVVRAPFPFEAEASSSATAGVFLSRPRHRSHFRGGHRCVGERWPVWASRCSARSTRPIRCRRGRRRLRSCSRRAPSSTSRCWVLRRTALTASLIELGANSAVDDELAKLKAELGAGAGPSALSAGEPAGGAAPESPRPASGADSTSGAGLAEGEGAPLRPPRRATRRRVGAKRGRERLCTRPMARLAVRVLS